MKKVQFLINNPNEKRKIHFFIKNPIGTRKSSQRMYSELNERIERTSELFQLALAKCSLPCIVSPPLMISLVKFYILHLDPDESFLLPFPTVYVPNAGLLTVQRFLTVNSISIIWIQISLWIVSAIRIFDCFALRNWIVLLHTLVFIAIDMPCHRIMLDDYHFYDGYYAWFVPNESSLQSGSPSCMGIESAFLRCHSTLFGNETVEWKFGDLFSSEIRSNSL